MTNSQRERLFEAMLGKVDRRSYACKVLSQIVAEELSTLEPIINEIVEEEITRRKHERLETVGIQS